MKTTKNTVPIAFAVFILTISLYHYFKLLADHQFQSVEFWLASACLVALPICCLFLRSVDWSMDVRRLVRPVRRNAAVTTQARSSFQVASQHFERAMALKRKGQYFAAIREYRTGLTIHSKCKNVHLHLGRLLRQTGQFSAAVTEFQQELTIQPNSVSSLLELGRTLAISKRLEEACAILWQGIQLEPENVNLYFALGMACLIGNDFMAAKSAYQEAVRLAPDYASAHTHLGHAYGRLYSDTPNPLYLVKGMEAYQEALRLDPAMGGAHRGYSTLLFMTGQIGLALRHLIIQFC